MSVSAWERILEQDPDKHFLLEGVKDGFHLITEHCGDNKLVINSDEKQHFDKKLQSQIDEN